MKLFVQVGLKNQRTAISADERSVSPVHVAGISGFFVPEEVNAASPQIQGERLGVATETAHIGVFYVEDFVLLKNFWNLELFVGLHESDSMAFLFASARERCLLVRRSS